MGANATTEHDITKKTITPLGGFMGYGIVRNDYVMIKGSVQGPRRRVITLRRPMAPQTSRAMTKKEKQLWYGTSKRQRMYQEEKQRKERLARAQERKAAGGAKPAKAGKASKK